jgi:hypothetical protein
MSDGRFRRAILKRDIEIKQANGPVITYKLDPAELEKLYPTKKKTEKEIKMILHDSDWRAGLKRKKGENKVAKNNSLKVNEISVEGKELRYKATKDTVSIIKNNNAAVKFGRDKLGDVIKELQQLKELI